MDPTFQPIEMPEINYDYLEEPPCIDQNLLNQIDVLIKSGNWTESHQCVTMLRQINKYFSQYIPDVVNRYSNALLDLLNNGKTQIVKNILRLIKEIFDKGQQINIEKAIYPFLPLLLKKSVTEIGHIKQMSQLVLSSFSENCGYDISFVISAEFCDDKNIKIAEISIKLLTRLIQKVGANIVKLNPETLQCLMQSMQKLIKGKRESLKTNGLDICMFIYSQIGSENYLNLMNYSLPPEDITHRTNTKAKHIPLANVLRQRKTEMMMNKENRNFGNVNYHNANYNPYNNNGF